MSPGLRSVRLRGMDGLAAVRRTVDIRVEKPLDFRMDLLVGAVDRVRVLHVVSTAFAVRWPDAGLSTASSAFLLPMEGTLGLETEAGFTTVTDGGLALSAEERIMIQTSRPARFLTLCIDAVEGDRMHRLDGANRLPPSPVTTTARTVLRAFLADLDVEHPVQSEYLQGTVLRLGRLLSAVREEDSVSLGVHDMVEAAVQVILADYADPHLDPATVAFRCQVSLRSLQRAMAQERQTTLRDFIVSIRTKNALRLVAAASDEVPLADIASSTGFTSPDRLRRAIAAETGLSPTEYRRRRQLGGREAVSAG
ncbi:hypothetical protein C5E08_14470 [Rathayibacter iranicus]|uniref:AraC family transcriptional regulator n=2 Tax=Rathayibacter iranicus TaxID=59737 RepID=A0AAD1AEX8_9MICO|nr:AraC family transcriptional regulator [Rathayibacter iranicus]PPI41913.1 hypothetical protein C5E09_13570 [Rathayibacter iranicus]PPI57653.1 hypothetical protein C5E08_14470 [Rathayibacter iranicus]PPI68633.1 hypothetical protein C5E01_13525 [Rathayibacter iranicus]